MTSRLRLVQRIGLLWCVALFSACYPLQPLAVDKDTLEELATLVSDPADLFFECTVLEGGQCGFLDPLTETLTDDFARDVMLAVIADLGHQHIDESINSVVRVRCALAEGAYTCSIFRGGTWQDLPVE
jgi:hypothetical protein